MALAPLEVVAPALLEDAEVLAPLVEEEVDTGAAQEAEATALLWRRLLRRRRWRMSWRRRRSCSLQSSRRRWSCWSSNIIAAFGAATVAQWIVTAGLRLGTTGGGAGAAVEDNAEVARRRGCGAVATRWTGLGAHWHLCPARGQA